MLKHLLHSQHGNTVWREIRRRRRNWCTTVRNVSLPVKRRFLAFKLSSNTVQVIYDMCLTSVTKSSDEKNRIILLLSSSSSPCSSRPIIVVPIILIIIINVCNATIYGLRHSNGLPRIHGGQIKSNHYIY